jgi:hypothetical protein
VSTAVNKGAEQLLQLLQGTTAAAAAADDDDDVDSTRTEQQAGSTAAAAAAAGGSVAGVGLPLMVNGQMVARGGGLGQKANLQLMRGKKKHDKANGEFRARLIKKFSAKTQVSGRVGGWVGGGGNRCG